MARSTMLLPLLSLLVLVTAARDVFDSDAGDVLRFVPGDNVVRMERFEGKPPFCNKLECPLYDVIKKYDTYELRQYNATLWAESNVKNIDYSKAQMTNFMRLFNYIQGANVKKQKIPMTVPVTNKIIPGQGPACESDFTMSFYLSQNPRAFKNFPKPTGDVRLARKRKFRVYVRSFSGYVTKYDAWRAEAVKLIAAIGDTTKYDTRMWYTAGYNSPFTLFNRHNEIWFFAK